MSPWRRVTATMQPGTRRSSKRSSLKSLSAWFSDQVSLSSEESSSDSDGTVRAPPVAPLVQASGAGMETSKLHERLVARIEDLEKRMSAIAEAKQERVDKDEIMLGSNAKHVPVVSSVTEVAKARFFLLNSWPPLAFPDLVVFLVVAWWSVW